MASGNVFGQCTGTAFPSSGWQGDARPDMPKMDVNKELTRLTKRYALSEVQKAQIRPVLVDVKAKMDAWSKDSSTKFGERMQEMRAIHDEQISRVPAILSDEQRAKYQKDTERNVRDRNDGPPDGSPLPPSEGQGGGKPPP